MNEDGIFAYMSKPGKSGKRKYVYKNYNTNEYSFDKLDGVEYEESKLVYTMTEHLKRMEKLYEGFEILKPTWKRI